MYVHKLIDVLMRHFKDVPDRSPLSLFDHDLVVVFFEENNAGFSHWTTGLY